MQAISGLHRDAHKAEDDEDLSSDELDSLRKRPRAVFETAFLDNPPVRHFDRNVKDWDPNSERPCALAMRIRQLCDHWKKEAPGMLLSLNPAFVWDDDRANLDHFPRCEPRHSDCRKRVSLPRNVSPLGLKVPVFSNKHKEGDTMRKMSRVVEKVNAQGAVVQAAAPDLC